MSNTDPIKNSGGSEAVAASYKKPTCCSYIQLNPRKVLAVIE